MYIYIIFTYIFVGMYVWMHVLSVYVNTHIQSLEQRWYVHLEQRWFKIQTRQLEERLQAAK